MIEAKKEGDTLTGVEVRSEKYANGLPGGLPAPYRALPFLYQSTGTETRFTNALDPDVIAAGIVEDLKAALEQFAEIQADLSKR